MTHVENNDNNLIFAGTSFENAKKNLDNVSIGAKDYDKLKREYLKTKKRLIEKTFINDLTDLPYDLVCRYIFMGV